MTGGQILFFQLVFRKTHCLLAAARAARTMGGGGRSAPRFRRPSRPSNPLAATERRPPRSIDDDARGLDLAIDALESEAVRRALSGVAVPVFHQGHECGSTVKHSDQLLMFLLKTLRPERYATPREEQRGHGSTPPVELDIDLSAASGNDDDGNDEGNGED